MNLPIGCVSHTQREKDELKCDPDLCYAILQLETKRRVEVEKALFSLLRTIDKLSTGYYPNAGLHMEPSDDTVCLNHIIREAKRLKSELGRD